MFSVGGMLIMWNVNNTRFFTNDEPLQRPIVARVPDTVNTDIQGGFPADAKK